MRDPEPCRIKHTEDTEQQTGWCLFFTNNADGYNVSSRGVMHSLILSCDTAATTELMFYLFFPFYSKHSQTRQLYNEIA